MVQYISGTTDVCSPSRPYAFDNGYRCCSSFMDALDPINNTLKFVHGLDHCIDYEWCPHLPHKTCVNMNGEWLAFKMALLLYFCLQLHCLWTLRCLNRWDIWIGVRNWKCKKLKVSETWVLQKSKMESVKNWKWQKSQIWKVSEKVKTRNWQKRTKPESVRNFKCQKNSKPESFRNRQCQNCLLYTSPSPRD